MAGGMRDSIVWRRPKKRYVDEWIYASMGLVISDRGRISVSRSEGAGCGGWAGD